MHLGQEGISVGPVSHWGSLDNGRLHSRTGFMNTMTRLVRGTIGGEHKHARELLTQLLFAALALRQTLRDRGSRSLDNYPPEQFRSDFHMSAARFRPTLAIRPVGAHVVESLGTDVSEGRGHQTHHRPLFPVFWYGRPINEHGTH